MAIPAVSSTSDASGISEARKALLERLLTARKNPKPLALSQFNWELSQEILKEVSGSFSDWVSENRA